jgi:hypothetical protein
VSDVKRPPTVSYAHRYKRPPRKKQPVQLTGPAVVTKRATLPSGRKRAAEPPAVTAPPPANADGKPASSAIVTTAPLVPASAASGWQRS